MHTKTASASSAVDVCWNSLNWPSIYNTVRKLQIRIAKATRERNWRKVKSLQRFLTRSLCGKAIAVRRVTENRGKTTPGVDGVIWPRPEDKSRAIKEMVRRGYTPKPLKRVFIPKSNGKKRPLGIPTMKDRAMQALYMLALDPVSETLADSNSYGFRPNRSCADAIEQCFTALAQKQCAQWVLEADIQGCFDHISHEWIIDNILIDKVILRKWLHAGYVDNNQLFPTSEGTPQGGIISPLLANMALDGLEAELESHFGKKRTPKAYANKVNFVRYADDFVITGDSKEMLVNEVKPLVERFLYIRGLKLATNKTRVTHIEEGFDFLGQNVRKYKDKLIIKPSRKSVKSFMDKVRKIIKGNKAVKQVALIRQLNPVITGWSNYHRHICAKETFNKVDYDIWYLIRRWSRRRHPKKSFPWIKNKYFESVGDRNWVFTADTGKTRKDGSPIFMTLVEAADTPIRRHVKIKSLANPYDPECELYFEKRLERQMRVSLKRSKFLTNIWNKQEGKCPVCEQPFTSRSIWDIHHIVRRVDGGQTIMDNLVMLHPTCHKQIHSTRLDQPAPVKQGFVEA